MKRSIAKILINGILFTTLLLCAACTDQTPATVAIPPTTQAIPTEAPTPEVTTEPTVASTYDFETQYATAEELCNEWLSTHPQQDDSSVYGSIVSREDKQRLELFGEYYYEFLISYAQNDQTENSHSILMHSETGELFYYKITWSSPDEYWLSFSIDIQDLEGWYSGTNDKPEPEALSVQQAATVYLSWLETCDDHFKYSGVNTINRYFEYGFESVGMFTLFNNKYYIFHTDETYSAGHIHVLVHSITGEMLSMSYVGMGGDIADIKTLDDWYSRWQAAHSD